MNIPEPSNDSPGDEAGPPCASIDIGSNSVKLLIGRQGTSAPLETIHEEIVITGLKEGMTPSGTIPKENAEKTLQTVRSMAETARGSGVCHIRAGGTSAVREAQNKNELVSWIEESGNIDVEILSAEQEARYSYMGVLSQQMQAEGRRLLADIGGGSTEFIRGNETDMTIFQSLSIGSVSYYEEQGYSGILSMDACTRGIQILVQRIGRALAPEMKQLLDSKFSLIGVGGTVATLAQVDLGQTTFRANEVDGHILSRHDLEKVLKQLARIKPDCRREDLGVQKGREEYIIGGALIASALLEVLNKKELIAATGGVRHGLLLDHLNHHET